MRHLISFFFCFFLRSNEKNIHVFWTWDPNTNLNRLFGKHECLRFSFNRFKRSKVTVTVSKSRVFLYSAWPWMLPCYAHPTFFTTLEVSARSWRHFAPQAEWLGRTISLCFYFYKHLVGVYTQLDKTRGFKDDNALAGAVLGKQLLALISHPLYVVAWALCPL